MKQVEALLEEVRKYNPKADLDLLRQAYLFASKKHQGQTRRSGDPYLIHPLEVAKLLARLRLDVPSLITGLLHDIVEDTSTSLDDIEQLFGKEVKKLVDGLTKISKLSFSTREARQAENFRKMVLAMAEDIRVVLIKLSDRVHNMRTLKHLGAWKRMMIAQETLDIYAPIANRLGIQWMKVELEDLALKYLKPESYHKIYNQLQKEMSEREKYGKEVKAILSQKISESGIKANVSWRLKHINSIYHKMERQNIQFEQVFDIVAFRVLVRSVRECYEVLGLVHSIWKPIPGRFKDYIAMPKANHYQSLHTSVIGTHGQRIEIQIRTEEMHRVAENGIAAHWKYKDGGAFDEKDHWKFQWVRELLEWQKTLTDADEFLDTVRMDLFQDEVYVFTPRGDVKAFPAGSTPIDFAYSIHTDVGHQCVGAKVNGKIVPLRYKLKSGDSVEILTQKKSKPSKDWVKIAKTSRAKAKIRQVIKAEQREKSILFGSEALEKALRRIGLSLEKISKTEQFKQHLERHGYNTKENLFMAIGYGKLSPRQVIAKIIPDKVDQLPEEKKPETAIGKIIKKVKGRAKSMVLVKGVDDILVSFGKCCNPLPGDSIIGFITRGRGVTVHASNCQRVLATDPQRRIEVSWDLSAKVPTNARIKVVCVDSPGLLANISKSITLAGANISLAQIRTTSDKKAINIFEVGIIDRTHLQNLINSVEKIKGVISVERIRV